MIPALAPSTPASHDPSVLTTTPFSYSFVSSPKYLDVALPVLRVPSGRHASLNRALASAREVNVKGILITFAVVFLIGTWVVLFRTTRRATR
jgi:hypothetical protein